MNQMSEPSNVGMQGPQPKRCPLCGATVIPDPLGLYECACGWGGPGDPLEHDRGLGKLFARTDRDLANGQAHRDLSRLATRGDSASSRNVLYLTLLLLVATVIYLAVLAVVALCLWLAISSILDHTWVGAVVGGILLALVAVSLWPRPRSHKGMAVTHERFPALMAALDEVSKRVGVPVPKRVLLVPDDDLDIGRRLIGGNVLHIGAANVPLLSDVEFKSLLTHELAHAYNGGTALHRYCAQAEKLLHELVYGILEGARGQSVSTLRSSRVFPRSRRYSGNYSAGMGLFGLVFTWTVMLPFRLFWSGYHLLRMHQVRSLEFAADRAAIHAYGPQAFINGLTGLLVARRTFVKSSATLRGEMLRHNSQNFFAEMRRHYEALPPNIIAQLRVESTAGFRSLARSHPTTGDRLRAAYQLSGTTAPSPAPTQPAYMLLAPAGAPNADAVEIELTKLLFAPKKK
jgi:Zn-dependent protease with chaperone function